jgi:hemerythrin-like domain-containing protein
MPDKTFASASAEDAIDLLTTDHDEVAQLFDRFDALASDGAPADQRRDLAEEICSLLQVHSLLEQELFYPAARDVLDEEYLVDEALVAHDSAQALIDDILSGDPTEPRYDAQVRILQELVAQHVEEEETELFPRVRRTSLDLEELGAEMSARQEVLMSIGEDAQADAP